MFQHKKISHDYDNIWKRRPPRTMEIERGAKHSKFTEDLLTFEMTNNMYIIWTMITFLTRHILWLHAIMWNISPYLEVYSNTKAKGLHIRWVMRQSIEDNLSTKSPYHFALNIKKINEEALLLMIKVNTLLIFIYYRAD